jgi:signal transduction histidine kinase
MNILYAIYLLVAAVILLFMAVIGWRRRSVPTNREFALFSASVGFMLGAYALELTQENLDVLKYIDRLFWLFCSYITTFWLLFSLAWSGYGHLANRFLRTTLLAFSTITMLLTQTNDYHGLIYTNMWVDSSGQFPILQVQEGLWYRVYWVYVNGCNLIASIMFVRQFRNVRPLHRRQALIMVLASLIPWLTDIGYELGVGDGLFLTAFGLSITAMLCAWGIFRKQLLNMTPVARHGLVEIMRDPVLVFDEAGRVVDHNLAACWLLHDDGNHGAEATREDIHRRAPELLETLDRVQHGEAGTFHYEDQVFSLSVTVLYPTHDQALTLCLLHNITEQSRAEEELRLSENSLRNLSVSLKEMTIELRNKQQSLEEALERQIRFVDMVSHEYRTPLAIIRTNLDLLRDSHEQARHNAVVETMQRAVARLVEVVETSLGVSRLTGANRDVTRLERVETADFLSELRDEACTLWPGSDLLFPPRSDTLIFLLADRAQLKTAFLNLIGNAIKYGGKAGQVTISLASDSQLVTISVADRGQGIAAEELKNVRKRFMRGRSSSGKSGAGIGLYLVDKIVQDHGGEFKIILNYPHGTVATVILPRCA